VPVNPETTDKWKHPPYSGHFDGERIWGRGTADDKNGLIAILSVYSPVFMFACPDFSDRAAVEYLVSASFEPARTLVLAFGFDEEATGAQVHVLSPHDSEYAISLIYHRALGLCPSIYWTPSAGTHSH
jgi:Gly-Xaa carboxypeptidase